MSTIEASITLNIPDGVDPEEYISMIDTLITNITKRPTEIHVSEVDNPLTTNTIGPR